MNVYELVSFILYFIVVLGIGFWFFFKKNSTSEKDYFLGGREMGGWVSALSAGASDMSAWVLMGLPGAIFAAGLSQIWISVGLVIGTVLAWVLVAPRLRKYAIKADDSITIPQFLSNRFKSTNGVLRISCAVVFVVGYLIYSASSIYACGNLFNLLVPSVSVNVAMIIATVVIVVYTLLGGFNAVCWTDFFQGMLMLAALMLVPIIAFILVKTNGPIEGATVQEIPNYYSLLSSGKFDWSSVANILTGLSWGLGYFGMPHILVRYMAIKNEKELRKSQIIGSTWSFLICLMATILALVAHEYLGDSLPQSNKQMVFVTVLRNIFKVGALGLIGGMFISAIVAASMSTADSQLLASSSAFASDIYKTTIKKDASDKEMMWVGRIAVIAISVLAFVIALLVNIFNVTDIMGLVSAAWSIFGAAFGPVIILSLFWKRFNYKGACVSIIVGFVVSVLWMILFNLNYYGSATMPLNALIYNTGIYEILPGFILGIASGIIVSLSTKAPSEDVVKLFEEVYKKEKTENV